MIIVVDEAGISLGDAADLKKFAVASSLDTESIAATLTASEWGSASEKEGHVAISVSAVRTAVTVSGHATDAWNDAFAGMLAFAESKGWMVDQDHILAHVDTRP